MPVDLSGASLNHIGITVRSVSDALDFWQGFLGRDPIWRRTLDGAYLSQITGYSDLVLEASLIELTPGVFLELLDYKVGNKHANDMGTANPGNVHVCLSVPDVQSAWSHAKSFGAQPISEQPVTLDTGPNAGSVAAYVRIHDGVTLELVQRPTWLQTSV